MGGGGGGGAISCHFVPEITFCVLLNWNPIEKHLPTPQHSKLLVIPCLHATASVNPSLIVLLQVLNFYSIIMC